MIPLQKGTYGADLKEKIQKIIHLSCVQEQMKEDCLTIESFLVLDEFINVANNQPIIGLNGCCLFMEKYFRELFILLNYKNYSHEFGTLEDYTDYIEEQTELKRDDPKKDRKTEYNFLTFVEKVQSELGKSCISNDLKNSILDFYQKWRHVTVHGLFRRGAFSISNGEKMSIGMISLNNSKAEVIQIEKDHLLFRPIRIKNVCSIALLDGIDLAYDILESTYAKVFHP